MNMYKSLFRLTPHVMGISCDEAYIDVSAVIRDSSLMRPEKTLNDIVKEVAEKLRKEIYAATEGCTASIGCGSSRFLARLATKTAKPNGFWLLEVSSLSLVFKVLSVNSGQ